MQLDFQKSIANSQMTLPVVGLIAAAMWFVLPLLGGGGDAVSIVADDVTYGLWHLIPQQFQTGYWGLGLGLALAAVVVYLLAELNNSNVLLRISSRMLSSTLIFILMLLPAMHTVQPGLLVMAVCAVSFFPLFATYQLPHPKYVFLTYLLLSLASLAFPKLLLMLPVYWVLQGYLRSMTFRCLMASLIGVVLPYWAFAGIAYLTDSIGEFVSIFSVFIDFSWYEYSQLTTPQISRFAFVLLLFVVGVIDFYRNNFLDKTRTRILYNTVIIHAAFLLLFLCLQPQYFSVLFALFTFDTAIIYGHFFALTYTKFSHILNIVIFVLALGCLVLQLGYV